MEYSWKYKTPEGFDDLVMCGDGEALTGLWFEGSRNDWRNTRGCERRETPVFRDTRRWLDEYFAGHDSGFTPNYRIEGLTPFRQAVLDEMLRIPYGATVSYGDIAKAIAKKRDGVAMIRASSSGCGKEKKRRPYLGQNNGGFMLPTAFARLAPSPGLVLRAKGGFDLADRHFTNWTS